MKKAVFCICENKLGRSNREADQRLCFRNTVRTIHLLPKFEISSLFQSSVAEQPGLCWMVGNPEDRFSHDEAQLW